MTDSKNALAFYTAQIMTAIKCFIRRVQENRISKRNFKNKVGQGKFEMTSFL